MTTEGPIAVVGATGQQGGAVAEALLERGASVRALVRDEKKGANLAQRGVELVVADQDDPESLRHAFTGAAAVFMMTTMIGPDGTDGEIAHGKTMADAAQAVGVPLVVFSSVGGAERHTGIPHFESKWQVEEYLRSLGVPTVVVRPAFFMDNFTSVAKPTIEDGELVLRVPLRPDVPLQMVAVRDIGRVAAAVLLDPTSVSHGAIEIAGDELTAEEVAAAMGRSQKLPARFEELPVEVLGDDDQAAMFTWFKTLPAYQADIDATHRLAGDLLTFEEYAAEQDFS